jgi:cytochrome c oxidase cbb3-type subunit 2
MRYLSPFIILLILSFHIEAQDNLQNGKRLYEGACLPCHGTEGDGNGPGAAGLNSQAKDFTTGWYKFRSTPHGQMPSDDDIARTISRGVPRTTMPAFEKILHEDEILDIVQYLKTFSDRFERWGTGDPIEIPPEIPMTNETIAEGQRVYQALKCWECHGLNGKGKGPLSSQLKDENDNPIKAFDFTSGLYKGGSTSREIYKTFNTGLSGTPMGTYFDAFLYTQEDFEDLSAYEKYFSETQLNDFRAYITTLPTRTEMDSLTPPKREELANRRRWSLVHFVKSLIRPKGWFYKLFFEDIEVTK